MDLLSLVPPGGVVTTFLRNADGVLRCIVTALLVCSVASWAIMIEKVVQLRALRRAVVESEQLARQADWPAQEGAGLIGALLTAGRNELREAEGNDVQGRVEAAMRIVYAAELRRHNSAGLSFLATVASTAPFVGLLGTVWGIINSFSSIADAKDTSLAAVAPGIAEALFATAVGLATAIPAVVGYNQIRAASTRFGQRLAAASAAMARNAARSRARFGMNE